jgi:fluoride ion exporter CrcB/FEX
VFITFVIRVFKFFLINYLLSLLSKNTIVRRLGRGLVNALTTFQAYILESLISCELALSPNRRAQRELYIITLIHILSSLGRPTAFAR